MSSIWMFLQIDFGDVDDQSTSIGPHRANILEAVDRFGSISAAALSINLTFRRLWAAVQTINKLSDKQPLIGIRRTGRSSGAFLTPLGKEVLAQFREIQRVANEALEPHLVEFEKLVGLDPHAQPPVPNYLQINDPDTIARKKKPMSRPKTRKNN
ncbi:hypothetical protein [Bradyrhizobium sp. dw_411]|uniref:winged helix-turn-helix domain-containing protein n=1 Tax=Bradyrhizobium sp. dw_411 TaxID=2720082 RepID=UPI001BCC84AF|nr:hypothetical protein [Bradyrhizobium sp. dw_411]